MPVAVITLALVVLCYGSFWSSSNGGEDWRAVVATVGRQAHRGRRDRGVSRDRGVGVLVLRP